jgi:DNA segregation ATPase FtsK/SpoIIIE-like protein
MEDLGLVSEPNGQKPREVLLTREEWREMLSRRSLDD